MKRYATTVFSVLSLLACAGLGVVWIWDSNPKHVGERYLGWYLGIGNGHTVLQAWLDGHGIALAVCRYEQPYTHYEPGARFIRMHEKGWLVGQIRVTGFTLAGFEIMKQCVDSEFRPVVFVTEWRLTVPQWFLIVLTGLLPLYWVIRQRKQRWKSRRDAGLCEHCGYDIRASIDRCPECGAQVPAGHVPSVTSSS